MDDEEELLEVMINDDSSQPYGNPILIDGQLNNRNIVKERAFQTGALRANNYKTNDFRDKSNMREEDITMMTEKARMIRHVYDNTRAYGMQSPITQNTDRKNYVLANEEFEKFDVYDTGSSLSQIFVDEKDKKITVAMRGLSPVMDNRDRHQLVEMGYSSIFPKELDKERVTDFGRLFGEDVNHLTDVVNAVKINYPDYDLSIAGHSRGGAASLEVGRAYNLKTYAFNPAGNRREKAREFTGYDPTNINIFTSDVDKIPKFIKENVKFSPENNHMIVNKRAYGVARGHEIHHFIDESNIRSIRKKTKTILDQKKLDKMMADELVPYYLERSEEEPPQKMIAFKERLKLGMPSATERVVSSYDNEGLFNSDEVSVFSVLNKEPDRPFEPYRSTFDLIDTNRDNKITYSEYKLYYQRKGMSEKAIKNMFNKLDVNSDGKISRNELI